MATPTCRRCKDTGSLYHAFYTAGRFCPDCEHGRALAAWSQVPEADRLAWEEALRLERLALRKAERAARRAARAAAA